VAADIAGDFAAARGEADQRSVFLAALAQEEHLVFPAVRIQRPAMAEDDGLSLAPVLVIDLRPVLGRDHEALLGCGWKR